MGVFLLDVAWVGRGAARYVEMGKVFMGNTANLWLFQVDPIRGFAPLFS